jgi:excisionase family DNA binding protein
MKFTRDRYQQGSLRRVHRAKGPDVWEFRFSTYENGVRKQKELTLSSKKFPTEVAVKRKVEALLLQLNSVPSRSLDDHPFAVSDFEPLPNSHQAATLLHIHHKTLQKLARRGEIRGSHVGKLWRFRASDLNAWLDRQQRAS